MKKDKDEYELIKVYEDEKAIVKVYRPILTEEERERRMQIIRLAAEDLLREKMQLDMQKQKAEQKGGK